MLPLFCLFKVTIVLAYNVIPCVNLTSVFLPSLEGGEGRIKGQKRTGGLTFIKRENFTDGSHIGK